MNKPKDCDSLNGIVEQLDSICNALVSVIEQNPLTFNPNNTHTSVLQDALNTIDHVHFQMKRRLQE